MITSIRPSRILFAASLIGIGITGLVNREFALGWQHIPIQHFPEQTIIAYVCDAIEVALGVGLLFRRTLTLTCRILFPYMILWVGLLDIPAVVQRPMDIDSWGTLGEIAIVTAGAWCLFAAHAGTWEKRYLKFAVGENGIRAARLLLILSLPLIALEVLLKIGPITRTLPPWIASLPGSFDWVFLHGAASLAVCLALLFSVLPRLAATLEAAQLAVITVWFWGPYLHTGHTANTAFFISFAIVGGVWLVADTYRGAPWFAYGRASRTITTD
ncbi:MAG: hypothetical protein ACRES7_01725 [Gammaproteobacteria bacterium]